MKEILQGTFWCVIGKTSEGENVVLFEYASQSKEGVEEKLISDMHKEKWPGSLAQWLEHLNWEVDDFDYISIPF